MEKKRVIKYILNEQSLIENKPKPCMVAGCSSKFTSLSNLNMHLEKHHGVQVKKLIDTESEVQYFCPIPKCKYNVLQNQSLQFFKSRKYLRQHYLKVHATKNEQCSKCDKSFANVSLKTLHERSCGMLFKCLDCNWEYTTRECLLTHCRRKGHAVPPKPAKQIKIETSPVAADYPSVKVDENHTEIIIAPKEQTTENKNQTNVLIKKVQRVLKNTPAAKIRANFQKILQKSRTISGTKVSQTTQTTSMSVDKDSVIESRSNEKYKSLELIDEDSVEDSTKANQNLNNLSYVEDESSLYYFTVNNFNAGLCHIETQTDLLPFDEPNIGTSDMDPLLCHMHTQTSDDILTELGLSDIQTQTNWPHDECNDIFVSTETQTCFDSHLIMDNISTHTQTSINCDSSTRPTSSRWLNNIQHQFTQTLSEP
ncbi:protein hunchback [Sitodiplosis mosellana]|uniref:protein hunchback n=1 Tax=Sitodiplosis mosellana TaxID=263140 RepID=UPI0024437C48|nr:protein hunchback [Sitodiplosis mosellana]